MVRREEMQAESAGGNGLLLVGHGTREPRGVEEFFALAQLVAGRMPHWSVEPCFLEFAQPDIAAGFRALAARGVGRVVVAPVMLFAAGHVQHDIPEAVARAARDFPDITLSQAEHFGCQRELIELSQVRFEQALEGRTWVAPRETALVMVGRGSLDAGATADMLQFAALRGARAAVDVTRACFVAMAEPTLEVTLDTCAASRYRRIVVQPHLLFYGLLLDRIAQTVAGYAERHPRQEWLVAPHLGAHVGVAQAVEVRATAALAADVHP